MAFNWNTFKTRSLTAVIFVIVMLAGLLWNKWSFLILFSIVHFGAWIEYKKLVAQFHPDYSGISRLHKVLSPLAGWCILLFFTDNSIHIGSINLEIAVLYVGFVLIYFQKDHQKFLLLQQCPT